MVNKVWMAAHSSIIPPLLPLCFLTVTLNIFHCALKVFDVSCLSLDILCAARLVSTLLCVKQSVALEQPALEIQYMRRPDVELLRNSGSLCAFVTGLDM